MKLKSLFISIMILILMLTFVGCSSDNESVGEDAYQNSNQIVKETEEEPVIEEVTEESSENTSITYPLTVETMGGQFTIEKEPMSIVSVAPNITEALYAIGAADKVIGRTSFCNYPAEVMGVPEIGSLMEPNIELIIELDPDIVIVSTHFSEEAANQLNNAGVQTIALYEPESFEGVYSIIEKLGLVTNRKIEAEAVVKGMQDSVEDTTSALANIEEKPSVYYVVSYGDMGDYTATGETFVSQMIELAGGNNVAKDATGWAYSAEKLVEDDPEIILIGEWMYEGFIATEPYTNLTAVKEGKVHIVNEDIINRQGPRLPEGLYEFAQFIYEDMIQK
ncbi:ABC transporter substrate-binding protein [Vallitalea okinawensis]|uniref:ABC transporter substrate-binding protein n=1 Tax=Vallitalea okinawensis TaxID=2078660 RepID=UPI000CFBD782|nr:ABC transporter substrate-binding protein [Vallitalea okinawensis]